MVKPPMKRRSFFKIMIGDFTTKLRIPPSFMKHLSKLRSKSVLRSLLGGPWSVEVGREDGGWFFRKGWEAFVAEQLIVLGDLLIFFYDGDLGFDVTIYGKSGCEKEAAAPPAREKGSQSGNPSETLITCLPATPRKSPAKSPFLLGKRSSGRFWVMRPSRKVEKEKVLEAACSFNTTNPHFILSFRKSRRSHVTIPRALVREHDLADDGLMILRDPGGRSWPVKVTRRRDGRIDFGTGWADFRRGNCLEEGDACVFEFVRDGIIHVHIFRVKEDTEELVTQLVVEEDTTRLVRKSGGSIHSDRRPVTGNDRERVMELANSFKTRRSKFVAHWRRSRPYKLTIPRALVREHDLADGGLMILRDPGGSSWPVKVARRGDGRFDFGTGWFDFRKGNCLEEGDACVFEFVRDGIIHVHIFRVKEDTEELVRQSVVEEDTTQLVRKSDLCDAGGSIQSNRRPVTGNDRESAIELANSFKTRHSKFVARWQRSRPYTLPIPMFLVRELNLKMKTSTVLHDPSGRSWPIKFCHRRDGRVDLGTGWLQFSRGNNLRQGDACVLEFVERANTILVHIFRVGGIQGKEPMICSLTLSS